MRSRPRRATIPPIWPHCGRLIRLLPTAAGRRWQRKRLEIFQRDRWRCQADECPELGRNDIPLHVHHLRYLAGCLPWDYPDELLASYCQTCHDAYHGY